MLVLVEVSCTHLAIFLRNWNIVKCDKLISVSTGPGNKPIFILTGEGHRHELELYVGATLSYFSSRISSSDLPISPAKHLKANEEEILSFPSKVSKYLNNNLTLP